MRADHLEVERRADQRSKRRVLSAVSRCVQFRLAKVADAGSEAKAKQVHQREDMVGKPGGVRVVLFDAQIAFVVEQAVEHVGRIAHPPR